MSIQINKVSGDTIGFHKPGVRAFLIVKDEAVVGFIMKYPNTRSEIHPWKVFTAGEGSEMLDFFYTDHDFAQITKKDEYTKGGGLAAAKKLARIYFDAI